MSDEGPRACGAGCICGALGAVLSDYHWRAFCDAWLAVGMAVLAVRRDIRRDDQYARKELEKAVGRTRRKSWKTNGR